MKINYLDIDNKPNESHDPFRTLIECILSHRTRTCNAKRAADNLFEFIESPEDILAMDIQFIKNAIRCSGFYNQKSRIIQNVCMTLVIDFNGKIPKKRTTLMAIDGIGPKTADIVLS
jgi:endonuclease III